MCTILMKFKNEKEKSGTQSKGNNVTRVTNSTTNNSFCAHLFIQEEKVIS